LVAVSDMNLDIGEGEFVGLIGPNGAGKSTLLNMIGGQLRPAKGRIEFRGQDITELPPDRRARLGIARTFQDSRAFATLSVSEAVIAAAMNARDTVDVSELLDEAGLGARADEICGALSYVDRKRVEIARALALKPDLLLLDEPFSGLSRQETSEMLMLIRRTADRRGLALLLVEHVVRSVMELCSRVLVMHMGRELMAGTPLQVRSDAKVVEVYLGVPRDAIKHLHRAEPKDAEPELVANQVSIVRGGRDVVRGVSLSVARGQVRCLLGANGAGKTTLLEGLAGITPVRSGQIDLREPGTVVRLVHQSRGLFPRLTVAENLELGGYQRRRSGQKQRIDEILRLFPTLASRLHVEAGSCSGGEQQMVAIARTLVAAPSVLLVDEPSIGLAPVVVDRIAEVLERLAEEGVALLLSEQSIEYALRISTYGYILEQGQVVDEGRIDQLTHTKFVSAYLGDVGESPEQQER
jgi:ABC-type branched-subunit amino acid transport system ATPase component